MTFASIPAPRERTRWAALALIVTAQFMVILDVAIVNVALPSIKSDLHFSEQSLQWAARNHFGLVAPGTVTQTLDIINYYRDYAETQCGWSPTSAHLGMAREFFIAPTKAQVDELLPELIANDEIHSVNPRFRVPVLTAMVREQWGARSYDYGSHLGRPAGSGRTQEGYAGGQFLCGDPDTVTQQIVEQRAACGNPGVLVIRPEVGFMSLEEVGDGLELFAREVLPVVRDL